MEKAEQIKMFQELPTTPERLVVRSQNEQTKIQIFEELPNREANRMMKVANELPNSSTLPNLGVEALYLITTLPEEEKQAQLDRVEQGDNPTVRELQEVRHERTTRKYKKSQHSCADWYYIAILLYHIWRAYVDNLTNIEYRYLDSVLMKYRHLPSRIARRKLEIETFHATDVNIGGGKTNQVTKRTEWLVERFDSDVKLKGLECQQRAVEATIELLDDTMKRLFELRWIDGYTPEEIAELTNSTVKNTQKKLERIMEIFADYWGWT